jgi:hypothetical protein
MWTGLSLRDYDSWTVPNSDFFELISVFFLEVCILSILGLYFNIMLREFLLASVIKYGHSISVLYLPSSY